MFICYDMDGMERGINLGNVTQYFVGHKKDLVNGEFDYNKITLYMVDGSMVEISVDYKKELEIAANIVLGALNATSVSGND